MRQSPGRWAALVVVGALVVGTGAAAFASAGLATLNLSSGSGRPGTTVMVTGASFAVPGAGTGVAPTPVVLRWQDGDGPVLAEAVPDRYGAISTSFTVPETDPGAYVILGVQETPRRSAGAPAEQAAASFAEPGTPARASFEVVPTSGGPTVRATSGETPDPTQGRSDLDSTVWVVLTAAFGAVAMSLFGGGLIAFTHQYRKSKEPARARWIPPGW